MLQAALIAYLVWRSAWTGRFLILALALADVTLISAVLVDTAVHWPSDVIGGLGFGTAWTMIALILARRSRWLHGTV
jgi:membrane-associated phospholipid phosphatase